MTHSLKFSLVSSVTFFKNKSSHYRKINKYRQAHRNIILPTHQPETIKLTQWFSTGVGSEAIRHPHRTLNNAHIFDFHDWQWGAYWHLAGEDQGWC